MVVGDDIIRDSVGDGRRRWYYTRFSRRWSSAMILYAIQSAMVVGDDIIRDSVDDGRRRWYYTRFSRRWFATNVTIYVADFQLRDQQTLIFSWQIPQIRANYWLIGTISWRLIVRIEHCSKAACMGVQAIWRPGIVRFANHTLYLRLLCVDQRLLWHQLIYL